MTLKCTMILGDCLDAMPSFPKKSVQMIFADLPYGLIDSKWDSRINLVALWSAIGQVRRIDCVCVFTAVQPFTTTLVSSNVKEFRHDIVWRKGQAVGFLNAKKCPLRIHETALVFGGRTYNPQMWDKGVERNASGARKNKSTNSDTYTRARDNGRVSTDRYPLSVLDIRDRENKYHSAQKPVALLDWFIRSYSNSGENILDPCSGSGTTAVAALSCGRNVVCIEKDKGYFEASVERVRKFVVDGGIDAEIEVRT